jgi:hypothetical protein
VNRREESAMKFIVTFEFNPQGRNEAIARFLATGGPTPTGTTLLGRWTAADFSVGFVLVESDDVKSLTEFALGWTDQIVLKTIPVIEDAELGGLLQRLFPR